MTLNMDKLATFAGNNAQLFAEVQKKVSARGHAGGENVQIVISGEYAIKELHINPSLFAKYDADQISHLIITAYNRARTELNCKIQEATKKIASREGIDLNTFFK